MATHSKATDAASKANRKRGGLMIKSLRNQMGYTQRELASKCELMFEILFDTSSDEATDYKSLKE